MEKRYEKIRHGKNNIGVIIAVYALLAVVMLTYSNAAISSNANGALSIMNLQVTPRPVIAGSNMTISFNLYNSYMNSLTNVDMALTASNPIINVSPAYSYITSAIGEGMFNGFIKSFVYDVHVPADLPEGMYTIYVTVTYQTTQYGNSVAGTSKIPIYVYVHGNPRISVDVSPQQVITPGKAFIATLTTINSGEGIAYNTTLRIDRSNSFIPVGQIRFNLGNIGDYGKTDVVSHAMLQSLGNITENIHFVNFTLNYQTSTGEKIVKNVSEPLNIVINKPNIKVSIKNAEPSELYSGGNQTVTLFIQNIGIGIAKSITLDMLGNRYIYPSSSATNLFIGELDGGHSTTAVVTINANRSMKRSVIFPIALHYYGSNYQKSYSLIANVPIKIQPTAIFNISDSYSNATPGDNYVPITFRVENTGNEQAQQVSFTLQSIYPITPVSSDAYVDVLSPGKNTSITFYVSIDSKGSTGQYPVTLYEQWRQPNGNTNKQYYGSASYYMNVKKKNPEKFLNPTVISSVILIVIAVGGYEIYIRYRKNKRKNKKK